MKTPPTVEIENIPKTPGCYIFKNKFGSIIYIGKSKSLRNRIRQHFNTSDDMFNKHRSMIKETQTVETIITKTETDALILECRLIKSHKPKYNSMLKKDRSYPFIRIDVTVPLPTISISDSILSNGSKYYGSFYSAQDAQNTIELMGSIWQTPTCGKNVFSGNDRPCLNYHLGKCCAPCGAIIEQDAYRDKISEIIGCLDGRFRKTISRLNREMGIAAQELRFEKAAGLRDSIDGLKLLKKRQRQMRADLGNKDFYLFFRAYNEPCYSIFYIKSGIVTGRIDFSNLDKPDLDELESFIVSNLSGAISVENGEFFAGCLVEIGADKMFVEVSPKEKAEKVMMKVAKAYESFVNRV